MTSHGPGPIFLSRLSDPVAVEMASGGRCFLVGMRQAILRHTVEPIKQAAIPIRFKHSEQVRRVAPALMDVLACPLTHAPLEQQGEYLISPEIQVGFSIKGGNIANMVISDGTLLSELRSVLPPPR